MRARKPLIKERIAQQPGAPYFMAQTIVMQDYALQQAQQRIEKFLKKKKGGDGLFSSLFGGGQNAICKVSATVRTPAPKLPSPLSAQPGRGGVLAGAAQTAMGVAGGVLIGNAIGGMFGGNAAKAAELLRPARQNLRLSQPPTSAAGSWTTSSTVAPTKTDRGEPNHAAVV